MSPEVDLVAGLVIGGAGIDVLRRVNRREDVALAAVPALLGLHQLIEAGLWLSLDGSFPEGYERPFLWAYLVIALLVLPLLIPVAFALVEKDARRRRFQLGLLSVGVATAAALLAGLWRHAPSVQIGDLSLAYSAHPPGGEWIVAPYVVATCGPVLLSSHHRLRWFGETANLAAVVAIGWLHRDAVVSLWCFWSALVSLIVADELRRSRADLRRLSTLRARAAC